MPNLISLSTFHFDVVFCLILVILDIYSESHVSEMRAENRGLSNSRHSVIYAVQKLGGLRADSVSQLSEHRLGHATSGR